MNNNSIFPLFLIPYQESTTLIFYNCLDPRSSIRMIIFECIPQETTLRPSQKRQNYLHFIWPKFKGKFSLVVTTRENDCFLLSGMMNLYLMKIWLVACQDVLTGIMKEEFRVEVRNSIKEIGTYPNAINAMMFDKY